MVIIMKKVLSLILVLVMCLGLYACASDAAKSSLAGLYKHSGGACKMGGSDIYLGWDAFYELNSDGSGRIYYEFIESHPDVSEETKDKYIEEMKETISWKEEDGYLSIIYNDGKIETFEKKGIEYVIVDHNSSYSITKVS